MKINKGTYFWLIIATAMLCSCNTTKFLKDDEALLKETNILFEGPTIENVSDIKSELENFYQIKPNGKFLVGIPREWYWYRNQAPSDTSKFKKWIKRSIAEEPAIVDTQLVIASATDMQNYLRNKKGFYEAEVNYDIEFHHKTAAAVYFVNPGKRYTINSINYDVKDQNLKKYINEIKKESILEVGDPLDALNFDLEKQRILEELQNKGFADFSLAYIDIKGDSTELEYAVDIFFEILNPAKKESHQQYYIGEINVFTDFRQGQNRGLLSKDFFNGKNFFRENSKFIVSKKAIDHHISIKTGQRYSRDNHYKTIQELTELVPYKFSKLSPKLSLESDSIIDYDILLTPHQNRWIMDLGNNLFYSTINTSGPGQRLIGFSLNAGLENRNLFGGAEKYTINAETGFEFNTPNANIPNWSLNTLTLGLQNNLEIPKLIDVLGSFKLANKLGFVNDQTNQNIQEDTKTSINIGYTRQDIVQFYNINTFNSSWQYNYQPDVNNRVSFTQIGFDLNSYDIDSLFMPIVDQNPLIGLSFEDVLFTGFLFRSLNYFHQTKLSKKKTYWAFLMGLEISGFENFVANKLYGLFSDGAAWTRVGRFDFANFVRFDYDMRWYKQFNLKSSLATRLSLGIATVYSDDQAVSYVKQFFVGGPNSIRAWQSRELGAGSYEAPPLNPNNQNIQFFQTGDIKIEFSTEYRFDLFWVLEGALFLDGGNIWTIREDVNRPGTQLSRNFLNEIALGTGWGLRWDFDYFIIRFDFGYKLRSPFVQPNGSQWISPLSQGLLGNVNVAVNYPF